MCTFRRVHVRIVILLVVLVVVVLVVSMRRCRSALKKRGASPLCWAQNGPGRPGERHVAEVEDGVRPMTVCVRRRLSARCRCWRLRNRASTPSPRARAAGVSHLSVNHHLRDVALARGPPADLASSCSRCLSACLLRLNSNRVPCSALSSQHVSLWGHASCQPRWAI